VLSDPARVAAYVRPDELQLAFNFTLLFTPWDEERIRSAIDRSLTALEAVGATPTWVLENHDVTRLPTRYGGGEAGRRRARAAALLLLALPGPVFLYAGQELGLEEVELPDEARQDPIFRRTNGARKGRDGCRVPVPWSRERPGFGFTDGRPWLPMPDAWADASVAAQSEDPGSVLSLYRAALALRPHGESFSWHDSPPGTLAFHRDGLVCLVNVGASTLSIPEGELLLASERDIGSSLPANTAAWIRRSERRASP
jgi:alpha-glucosidase